MFHTKSVLGYSQRLCLELPLVASVRTLFLASCDKNAQGAEKQIQTSQTSFQNELFNEKIKKRLAARVPKIEKIEVNYEGRGISGGSLMFMNRHLSTPHQCAMHISRSVAQKCVIALVKPKQHNENELESGQTLIGDGENAVPCSEYQPWDIHKPLTFDCNLQLLNFNMNNTTAWNHEQVNKAYWRSCAFILGAVLQTAFRERFTSKLLRIPNIPVTSGAFCCDLSLDSALDEWKPTEESLIFLTKLARRLIMQNLKFEPLDVELDFARQIFSDDPYHLCQLQHLVENDSSLDEVTLYRLGDYIGISDGPLISNTSLIFHYVVTAIHNLNSEKYGHQCRVQGLSLPSDCRVHHTIWSILEKRARKLIKVGLSSEQPNSETDELSENIWDYKSIENETKIFSKATKQWTGDRWSTRT